MMQVDKMLEMSKAQELERARADFKETLAQFKQVRIPADVEADLVKYSEEYLDKVAAAWTSRSATSVYTKAILENMSLDELEDVVAYLATEKHRKADHALQAANAKFTEVIQAQIAKAREREEKALLQKLLALRERMQPAPATLYK
jgi:hypothetical protein